MSFTVCEFKDKCEHQVTEDSFWKLCMGQSMCRDGETPYREAVCAWYQEYKNPSGPKALPREKYQEVSL